jgi:hypothetical protein
MATPRKNKVVPNTPQELQSPIQGNSILPSATANNSTAAKKTTKPKQPKLPSAPKEDVSIGVMNLDNPSTTKSPPLAAEEKNEKYRTWKPSARVSSSELFKDDKLSENILNNPQALQQHATNKLNSQFGDPARDSKDSDWKYKDEKLESLRDESYSAVESVINNKKFKIPENIREMFGKLGKSNWVSTGSARLAAHLRFNEQKDVREIAQLLEHATGESFTKDGTNTITTDQVGGGVPKAVPVKDRVLGTRPVLLY